MEVYKSINGYEGLYEISNFGNVKSVGRYVQGKIGLRIQNERILKPRLRGGYKCVDLCKYSKCKTINIHRLLYEAFKGELIPKMVIDHIDNNTLNNNLNNLQQITCRLNTSKDKNKKLTSSKYTGVSWHKSSSKWRSEIRTGDIHKHLGLFNSEIEAAEAYQNELKTIQQVYE